MARRVLVAKAIRVRVRGIRRLGLVDGVKMVLSSRGMTVEAA